MTQVWVGNVFDAHLNKGISAAQAVELLQQHDCLSFPQLRSGLFPAANFDNLEQDETGMADAWLRDTACIGMVLLYTNQYDSAARAAKGIISSLQTIRRSFENIVDPGHAPEDDKQRPPVRFAGQDSEPQYDWANAQNDVLGYCLQFLGQAISKNVLAVGQSERELIDVVVAYLDAVKYWQDADSGHWEEIKKVNASSIGTVVAGLKAVRDIVSDTTKIEALINKGIDALNAILPSESKTPMLERSQDAALVFLVEPQHIVSDDMAGQIIHEAEKHLMGEHGFRRYIGDSYWGPNYRQHFQLGDRTADFSNPETMALRDSYLTPNNEAQWTLIDPMIAAYYAHRYQKTNDTSDAEQAKHFLIRSLKSIVGYQTSNGQEVWRIPELFFLENGTWVPDDHLGLLWAQANLLYGLTVYEEVFGEALLSE